MKNSDMPAMPQAATSEGYSCHYYDYDGPGIPTGMTKREMMAMHIFSSMQGRDGVCNIEHEVRFAVVAADHLLAELESTK